MNVQASFPEQRRAHAGSLTGYIDIRSLPDESISGLLQQYATAIPFTWASCFSWSSKGNMSTTVCQKNQEPTTLPSTTSDRQRARVKRKNICKSKGVTRWRELESTYCVTSISARNTGAWVFFFEHRFQPLSIGGFI